VDVVSNPPSPDRQPDIIHSENHEDEPIAKPKPKNIYVLGKQEPSVRIYLFRWERTELEDQHAYGESIDFDSLGTVVKKNIDVFLLIHSSDPAYQSTRRNKERSYREREEHT
jgi:hypothetical protein